MKNKRITLQCSAEKQKQHVANEKSCVPAVMVSVSIRSGVLTSKLLKVK